MNWTSESILFQLFDKNIMVENVKYFFLVNKIAFSSEPFIRVISFVISQLTYGMNRNQVCSESELIWTKLIVFSEKLSHSLWNFKYWGQLFKISLPIPYWSVLLYSFSVPMMPAFSSAVEAIKIIDAVDLGTWLTLHFYVLFWFFPNCIKLFFFFIHRVIFPTISPKVCHFRSFFSFFCYPWLCYFLFAFFLGLFLIRTI